MLHVSAFSIGHKQAIHYIKHKYVYREILFASSQVYTNNIFIVYLDTYSRYILVPYVLSFCTSWWFERHYIVHVNL